MAYVIGKDDIKLPNIKRLTGAKQDVGKHGIKQRVRIAARSVEEQDGVIGMPGSIAVRLAERKIVQLQLGNGFARAKAEIFNDVCAIPGGPFGLSLRRLSRDG
jgi:hypothetical protein